MSLISPTQSPNHCYTISQLLTRKCRYFCIFYSFPGHSSSSRGSSSRFHSSCCCCVGVLVVFWRVVDWLEVSIPTLLRSTTWPIRSAPSSQQKPGCPLTVNISGEWWRRTWRTLFRGWTLQRIRVLSCPWAAWGGSPASCCFSRSAKSSLWSRKSPYGISQHVLLKLSALSGIQNWLVNDQFVPLFLQQLYHVVLQNPIYPKLVKVRVYPQLQKLLLLLYLLENAITLRLLLVFHCSLALFVVCQHWFLFLLRLADHLILSPRNLHLRRNLIRLQVLRYACQVVVRMVLGDEHHVTHLTLFLLVLNVPRCGR